MRSFLLVLASCITVALAIYSPSSPQCAKPTKLGTGCVLDRSVPNNCSSCVYSSQCQSGGFCCPYLKKCVTSSSQACYGAAKCSSCSSSDSADLSGCSCTNTNFPNNWVRCTNGSTAMDRYTGVVNTYTRKLAPNGALASDDQYAIASQCATNYYRNGGGLPLVEWNTDLALFAKQWAGYLRTNQQCGLQHSSTATRQNVTRFGFDYVGENLYMSTKVGSPNINEAPEWARDAIDGWYSEMKYYQYGGESNSFDSCPMRNLDGDEQIGHLTQLLWSDTTSIGCDYDICPCTGTDCQGAIVAVCIYGPGGNWQGEAAFNQVVADKLDRDFRENDKYGGLPSCTFSPAPSDGVCTGLWSGRELNFPWFGWGMEFRYCDNYNVFSPPNDWYLHSDNGEWDLCDNLDPDCPYRP